LDPLTGLHNRRYLELASRSELSRARREGRAFGLILLDLDRFKAFNDTFGHLAADEVLKAVACYLRSRLRTYDVACRYGGEEIVVLTPGADTQATVSVAEQLRRGIEELRVDFGGTRLPPVTASFGVSSYPVHGEELEALLKAADAALYRSKSAGRNRVSLPPQASV